MLQWKAWRIIYLLTLLYVQCERGKKSPLLEMITEKAMPLGDNLVSFKAKRRECSAKTLKIQCLLMRNFREFKSNIWKGR